MALSLKAASKIITDWLGGFVPWVEYRTSDPAPAAGELVPLTCDSTGGLRVAGGGATGATAPSRATLVGGVDGGGLLRALLLSAAGILQTSPAKGTTTSSTGLETSRVISASACLVARASMLNTNAGVRYIHVFDATSLPANGAVPLDTAHATTGQRAILTYAIPTTRFATGCVVAMSTTSSTLTLGAAEALFTVDQFPANA